MHKCLPRFLDISLIIAASGLVKYGDNVEHYPDFQCLVRALVPRKGNTVHVSFIIEGMPAHLHVLEETTIKESCIKVGKTCKNAPRIPDGRLKLILELSKGIVLWTPWNDVREQEATQSPYGILQGEVISLWRPKPLWFYSGILSRKCKRPDGFSDVFTGVCQSDMELLPRIASEGWHPTLIDLF